MPINPSIPLSVANIPPVQIPMRESRMQSLAAIAPGINAMRQLEQHAVASRGAAQIEEYMRSRGHNVNLGELGALLLRAGKVEEGSKLIAAYNEQKQMQEMLGGMGLGSQAAAPTGVNAIAQPAAAQLSVPNPPVTAPPTPFAGPSMATQGQAGRFGATPQQLAQLAASGQAGARVAGVLSQFAEKPQAEPEKLRLMKTLGFPQTQEGYRQFEEFGRAPQDTRTSDIKNYEAALKGGFKGSFYDYQTALKKAGAPSSTIKVDAFVPASEKAQEMYMKEVSDTRKALANAADTIKNVQAAKALIPTASTFMGTGGEPLLAVASFLNNRLGFSIATRGITDATELRTRLFEGILDNLKKLDSQPSQEQQRVLGEALGNLGTDPSALPRILDRIEETMRDRVGRYNQDVTEAENRGVRFPYKPQIDLPPVRSPSSRTSAGAGQSRGAPPVGTIQDGYRFRGGDPGEPSNWEQL